MSNETPNRHILIGGLVLLLIAAAFTIGALWQQLNNKSESAEQGVAGTQTTTTTNSKTRSVSVDKDDPVLGDPNAPITIIEISDFQCPYCANFEAETFDQLKEEYIDTGKVRFVYKDLPLVQIGHRNAPKAAEAAQCALNQDKFWKYQSTLFENQTAWAEEGDPTTLFKEYARDLALDEETFAACLDSGKMRDRVDADTNAARQAGIGGTPTFFISQGDTVSFDTAATREDPYYYLNGEIVGVGGAIPFTAFQQILDPLLQ